MEVSRNRRAALTDVPNLSILAKHQASHWNAQVPIALLPSELLGRVFSFLSTDRRDIAACRRVSEVFRKHATQFLITYVTFAYRPNTVTHLDSVMKHGYFRNHVTDFVFDASLYDVRLANDWDTYVEACTNSGRLLYDSEWLRTESNLRMMWDKFNVYSHRRTELSNLTHVPARTVQEAHLHALEDSFGSFQSSVYGGGHTHESAVAELRAALASDERGNAEGTDHSDIDDDAYLDSDVDIHEQESEGEGYFDRIFGMGCHKGFPAYHMAHRVQKDFQKAGLPSNIFAHVFTRFPKLRRVVFTDFRQHASQEDGYDECCRRRFGHVTLEPQHLCQCEETWNGFHILLNAIATASSASIKSLSIGSSNLEYCIGSCLCGVTNQQPGRVPRALPLDLFDELGELGRKNTMQVFANLHELELDFSLNDAMQEELGNSSSGTLSAGLSTFGQILHGTTTNLTHLELGVADMTQHDRANSDYHVLRPGSHQLFNILLSHLRFERLRHLDLRGWVFVKSDLQSFLSAHASTLCTLRLLYNVLVGSSPELAHWASINLNLQGIELRNWPDTSAVIPETDTTSSHASQDLSHEQMELMWLTTRHNMLDHISATKILNAPDEDSPHERDRMRMRMRAAEMSRMQD